ncbi:MAG TPA: haloalkane dehalogenase [Candidatus Eisenbacteria bacterium]|nr:haloalkane dehalogenase [Candidatus Eisenbacteria bacterium]
MIGTKPYAELKYREVAGRRMAYIDEGEGDAIVFQHGQPASSYVWRNVMPHLEGLGRLVACDLIGMGSSEKLRSSDPDRYRYSEHRDFLFSLWDALELGNRVVLVLHDWGAALGFEWARRNPHRVKGIVHMEAIAAPLRWQDIPEQARPFFRALRSPKGERMVLRDNAFIEVRLPGAVMRRLTDEEMSHYRKPFADPGEGRRATLSWPRSLPLDGEPADVAAVVSENSRWLAESDLPKLFLSAEPGAIVRGRVRELVRAWPHQREVTVKGLHTLQEDSPDEIGAAIADFVRRLSGPVRS